VRRLFIEISLLERFCRRKSGTELGSAAFVESSDGKHCAASPTKRVRRAGQSGVSSWEKKILEKFM